jgi:Carbohydrate esterase, sialic acid-specific acetylesterase
MWHLRKALLLAAALLGGVVPALGDGFDDVSGRKPVACHVGNAREIVLLTFGQSTAANHGEAPYAPRGDVVNFNPNDWLCYAAVDPLLGATTGPDNHTGSIWGYLCDGLLATKRWDRCIVAPIAQGGTLVKDWAPGGGDYHLIRETIVRMHASGFAPTALLWGQGEQDAAGPADPAAYAKSFNAMTEAIRRYAHAPLLVAVETTCDLNVTDETTRVARRAIAQKIADAQRAVVNPAAGIFPGPDLDRIGLDGRWDGCHLNVAGLKAAAAAWQQALLAVLR